MMHLSIEIEGETFSDLTLALTEVLSKVEQGYLSGIDQNESGSFTFSVEGEEEEECQ